MTVTPEAGYISSSDRTEGQGKQFLEDLLALIKEIPGGRNETELTISAGVVEPIGALHNIDTEADTSADDLTHMSTTHHPDGRILFIRANDADRTVTVKNGVGGQGQFLLEGGADLDLRADAYLCLVQRGGSWVQVLFQGSGDGGGFTPRGAWSAGVTYNTGDYVRHAGFTFASRIDNNIGNAPNGAPGDTAQWMYVPTIQGADGTPVNLDDLSDVGASDPEHGDILRYDANLNEWIKYNSKEWVNIGVVANQATIDIFDKDKFLLTVDADCELQMPVNAVVGAPFALRVLMVGGPHAFTYAPGVFKGSLPPVLLGDGDETVLSGIILDVTEDPYSATAVINLVKQIPAA